MCIRWCIPLEEESGLCSITELLSLLSSFNCFLFVCSFLRSLSFLLSKCMSLLFDAQGRPRRLKPFPTSKKQGTRGVFVPRRAPQGPARFQRHRELLLQSSLETCVCARMELEKENQGKKYKARGKNKQLKLFQPAFSQLDMSSSDILAHTWKIHTHLFWLSLKTVWEE